MKLFGIGQIKKRRIIFAVFGNCLFLQSKSCKITIMTTFALNNLWTYLQGLMLSQSDREWLVGKLSEPMEKAAILDNTTTVDEIYKTFPVSPKLKWLRFHISDTPKWNPQEAWNQLTEKQREEASTLLHFSAEDMDERTYYFIQKYMK